MNASTPECAECGLPLIGGLVCVGGHYQQPVRVEEPAGEPEPAEPMDEYVKRVAQSANADVREVADCSQHGPFYAGFARCPMCALVDTRDPEPEAEGALPGALPVPVGDETEALRAENGKLARDLLWERKEHDKARTEWLLMRDRLNGLREQCENALSQTEPPGGYDEPWCRYDGEIDAAPWGWLATLIGEALAEHEPFDHDSWEREEALRKAERRKFVERAEQAEARVAGLEATEASLRKALKRIAGGAASNPASEIAALARLALADSGEAGS